MSSYTQPDNVQWVTWSPWKDSAKSYCPNITSQGSGKGYYIWQNSTKRAPWGWNTVTSAYGWQAQQYWCNDAKMFQLDSMQFWDDQSWLILWRVVGNFRDYVSGTQAILCTGDFEVQLWSYLTLPNGVPGSKFPLPGFADWNWSNWYIYLKWNKFLPVPGVANVQMYNMKGAALPLTNPAWISSPSINPIVLVPAPTATVPITPALVGEPEPEVVLPPIDPIPAPTPIAEVPVDAPVNIPVAAPVSVPVDAPVDVPIEAPVTIPIEAPVNPPIIVEVPVTIPVDAPVNIPVEAPVDAPVDVPIEVPVTIPVEAPVNPPVTIEVPITIPVEAPVAQPISVPVEAPVNPPTNPPTSIPVSIPISTPITTPVLAPVTAPVAAPGVAGSCNITGTASQCRYFPGWHGLDCGCELRPVMDCVENIGGNNWKVWWGYKVWCRDGCRKPEFIRQPYGWGNRFFPGSSKRSGQPDTFCTANRQYSKVFSSQVTYNPKSFFGSLTFEAWVLGHRVALVVPSSFKNKQCSAASVPTSTSGGNGHGHYRQADNEFYDNDSDIVTKDFEEFDATAYNLARADEYIRTMTSATGYIAGYNVPASAPTPFIGRATCRNFLISGFAEVSTCFNVTLEDGTLLKTQCAEPDYEAAGFTFNIHVTVPRSQLYSKFFLDPRPAVPGKHWTQATYSCEPNGPKTTTTTTTTTTVVISDRAIVAPSSASSLSSATGLILAAIFAVCALFF